MVTHSRSNKSGNRGAHHQIAFHLYFIKQTSDYVKEKSFNVFLPKGRDWSLLDAKEDFNRK